MSVIRRKGRGTEGLQAGKGGRSQWIQNHALFKAEGPVNGAASTVLPLCHAMHHEPLDDPPHHTTNSTP